MTDYSWHQTEATLESNNFSEDEIGRRYIVLHFTICLDIIYPCLISAIAATARDLRMLLSNIIMRIRVSGLRNWVSYAFFCLRGNVYVYGNVDNAGLDRVYKLQTDLSWCFLSSLTLLYRIAYVSTHL